MAEKIVLETPINARLGASSFRIAEFVINVRDRSMRIRAEEWEGGGFKEGGTAVVWNEHDDDTWTAIKALNKIDLSSKSLQTRLLERLQQKGAFDAGTISGTPE